MGRNVAITIVNSTKGSLQLKTTNVEHGKFTQSPPGTILSGQTGIFSASNKDGALIGPKGSVIYSTTQNGKTFDVLLTWNHPWGAQDSAYTCGSNPVGLVDATLTPSHPVGHDQSIKWMIYQK